MKMDERPAGFLGEAQWSELPTPEEIAEQVNKFLPRSPTEGIAVRYTLQLLDNNSVKLIAERIAT